ncbi:DUF4258 domain-containing protein [Flavobacterium sp.]|uniref:DUF4258 domain-containing protein n=1 Tax=Flavobacterium sp. TaxID=239 RepID=UPI003528FABF
MNIRIRVAYYLLGLFIGVIGVAYFLTEKAESRGVEFCYFPNCRVLQDLRKKPLQISTEAQNTLTANWVTLDDIKKTLRYGDVDFSKSNKPFKNGKLYIIEGKNTNNEAIIVTMVNYTNKALLDKIEKK